MDSANKAYKLLGRQVIKMTLFVTLEVLEMEDPNLATFFQTTTEPSVDFFFKKKSLVDTTRTKHKFFGKLV